jgi:ribosomal protein L22
MSPKNPQDPQKGKPMEDVQASEEAKESAQAKAVEEAQASEAQPEAKPKRSRAKKPAENTAAAETGVDKDAAEAAKPKRARAKKAEDAEAATDEPSEAAVIEAEASSEAAESKPAAKKPAAKKPAAKKDAPKEEAKPARAASRRRGNGRRPVAEPAVLVRAQAKYVRTSARKARLVCDHIRGKDVAEARAILAFTPRQAAKAWSKLLESAVANAENNHELVGEELRIHSVVADEGPTLKRFRPRAMGRATRIRKRTSHLTITLTPKES